MILAEIAAIEAETDRQIRRYSLPPVFRPLFQPARYKGAYGGRGSGKSHAFAELLLDRCVRETTRAVCVREYQVNLEQSVKQLLEDKIHTYGLDRHFRVLNNYIEAPKDGLIIFQGMAMQTAEGIKSLEGYDIAWFEEAQMASERSLTLLRPTIRKPQSELWFSWNPRYQTDPVDVLLRGSTRPPDAVVVQANWQDNPFFPDVLRTEMEWDRRRDPEKYAHVWAGDYERHSESRVFKNWKVEAFDTPDDVTLLFGGDWGYSVDPTVLVRCWLRGRTLYIDHEAYQVGCEIDHIPTLFESVPSSKAWPIIADNARPETISYLNRHGYPKMEPARKGKDSVKEGIIFLQGYDIIVHPRCSHTIDELTMYSYVVDKQTGIVTPFLEDKKNHVIDSLRYAVEPLQVGEDFVSW